MATEVVSASEPDKATHRFAILDQARVRKLATVTLANDAGKTTVSVAADEPLLAQLSEICQNAMAEIKAESASATGDFRILVDGLRKALADGGQQVEDLPESDFTFSFEFDQRTGRVLSQGTATHDYASGDADLAQRMAGSIAQIFDKPLKDLADIIAAHAAAGKFNDAATALFEAHDSGRFFGKVPRTLLEAVKAVDARFLSQEDRLKFLRFRASIAAELQDYISAEPDAQALLDEDLSLDDDQRVALQTGIGIAELRRNHPEAALSIWRNILDGPQILRPSARGWLWRNIAKTLRRGEEALQAARMSADAFLQAGEPREAGASYMLESKMLELESPTDALKKLDNIAAITTQGGLIGSQLRASIHHAKANRLFELRQGDQALVEAKKAIDLRRGVTGGEDELISSLHLASLAAAISTTPAEQVQYHDEAVALEERSGSAHFALANEITKLLADFNREKATQVLEAARVTRKPELVSGATIAAVMGDPTLTDTKRLAILEDLLSELTTLGAREVDFHVTLLTLAEVLRRTGEVKRAIPFLERAYNSKPLDLPTAKSLASAYQAAGRWGEAAIAYKRLVDLFGAPDQAVILYCQALINAGAAGEAIAPLNELLDRTDLSADIEKLGNELRNKAFKAWSGHVQNTSPPKAMSVSAPVVKDELTAALAEFAQFVSSHKRMSFWRKKRDGSDYSWLPNPEAHAQDLTHTYLKAHFKTRVLLIEELDIGAGRMDILLKFEGGLTAVLELKMCGYGYSSTYAAGGEIQILHYMEQSNCHLGYLVAFDARLNDYGTQLLTPESKQSNTVFEIFVDLVPRVTARKGKRKTN